MFDSDQGPVESQEVKHLSKVPNLQVYRTDKDLIFFTHYFGELIWLYNS